MSQLSFFSADALPATPDDLEGLLCCAGQVVRQGDQARVSVVVPEDEEWRVQVLVDALHELGLGGEVVRAEGEALAVRTPFTPALSGLASRWSTAGAKRPPADLTLDGPKLRWWAMAGGRPDLQGFLLRLGHQDESSWPGIGAALARAGVPGALLGPRADGPAYRLIGAKRLARLRELVGAPPAGVPEGLWPPAR
ncbi:MAG TPA: hypothetical protein VNA14_03655 [Mycobacteriales bacterium]|nr:hypothetical protein [Mycobacteriales bacterium]